MHKSLAITVTIVLGLCSFTAFSQADVLKSYNAFKAWGANHGKQYGIEEMAVRYTNWKSNYDYVQEHNAKNLPWKLDVNALADMTPEEFAALNLGFNADLTAKKQQNSGSLKSALAADNSNATNATNSTPAINDATLPKSIDWRLAGGVSSVKNQGQCGSCWSFSSTGALEGLYAITNQKLANFSQQQMVDCSSDYGNQGCDGGLMTQAFNYTSNDGIQTAEDYEYTGIVGACQYDPTKVVFKNTGFQEVAANSSLALKAAVSRQPVSIAIEASSLTVQLFKSGVITSGCGTDVDHGVLAVGYDTDENGQAYWIVKNSWGSTWGLNGFFHIAMGDQNNGAGVCGINMAASYPTL